MKKKLLFISIFTILSMVPFTSYGASWQQNETGWWYQFDNGNYPANEIWPIAGKEYCFDENGYMTTGWKYVYLYGIQGTAHGKWGWKYFGSDGSLVKNAWVDGKYYVDENGVMLTDTWTPDGYYVDSEGEWVENYVFPIVGYYETSDSTKSIYDRILISVSPDLDDDEVPLEIKVSNETSGSHGSFTDSFICYYDEDDKSYIGEYESYNMHYEVTVRLKFGAHRKSVRVTKSFDNGTEPISKTYRRSK